MENGVATLKLIVDVGNEVRRQVEPKSLIRKEAQRRRQAVWRAIDKLWSQRPPIALPAKLTLDRKRLVALVAAA